MTSPLHVVAKEAWGLWCLRYFSRELDFIHDCTMKPGRKAEKIRADKQILRWREWFPIDLSKLNDIESLVQRFAALFDPLKERLLQMGKGLSEFVNKMSDAVAALSPLVQPIIDFLDKDWLQAMPRPWCGGELPFFRFDPARFAEWLPQQVQVPSCSCDVSSYQGLNPTDYCSCTSGSLPNVLTMASEFQQQFTTTLQFSEIVPNAPMCGSLEGFPKMSLRAFMEGLSGVFDAVLGTCVPTCLSTPSLSCSGSFGFSGTSVTSLCGCSRRRRRMHRGLVKGSKTDSHEASSQEPHHHRPLNEEIDQHVVTGSHESLAVKKNVTKMQLKQHWHHSHRPHVHHSHRPHVHHSHRPHLHVSLPTCSCRVPTVSYPTCSADPTGRRDWF